MNKHLTCSLVLTLGLSIGLIGCGGPKGPLVIDSFEGVIDKTTVDYGAAQNSSLEVTASKEKKVCGNQSLKLDYRLEEEGYMYCARGYGLDVLNSKWDVPFDEIVWSEHTGLSFQMYGAKSGSVAFDVKDNGGELHRFLIEDNFEGWKEITVPFASFQARTDWQPQTADGNKVLDFPIKSFQFEPKTIGSNTLYFDCVTVVK